ncbi:hypothetical protein [Lactococcus garvieae]|uniref:hypothetical protein n=1 Tax=Lactococcus garvieae TaxID=1363 RepID=UPI003854ED89
MNKENLYQINKIEQEIKQIDNFITNYYQAPRNIKLVAFKQNFIFSLQVKGYGILSETEYKLPYALNDEILKVVEGYRKALVAAQNELWGSE